MTAIPVRVLFRCQATRCECTVIVPAIRQSGERTPLYEYNISNICERCGHRLLGVHKPIEEVTGPSASGC